VVISTAAAGFAQRVISAKAGLVYFVQGRVSVEGSGRLNTGASLRQLRDGETLYSERGRAEILINPNAVLRLGDMSRLRMDDNTLTEARLCLQAGSAVVIVSEGQTRKPDAIRIDLGGTIVLLKQEGVYRLDASPDRLRVYDGRAEAFRGDAAARSVVKRGRAAELEDLQVARFDMNDRDAFERWAEVRSIEPRPRGFLRPLPPPQFGAERSTPKNSTSATLTPSTQ